MRTREAFGPGALKVGIAHAAVLHMALDHLKDHVGGAILRHKQLKVTPRVVVRHGGLV